MPRSTDFSRIAYWLVFACAIVASARVANCQQTASISKSLFEGMTSPPFWRQNVFMFRDYSASEPGSALPHVKVAGTDEKIPQQRSC